MSGLLKTSYRGWDITVRCLQFRARANTMGQAESYTASGHAVLRDRANETEWTDARKQTVTLGGRIFNSTATCAEVLLDEIISLIDALKKKPLQGAAPA